MTSAGISAQSRKIARNHSSTRFSIGSEGSKVVIAKVATSGTGSDASSPDGIRSLRQGPDFSKMTKATNKASALST